MSNSIDKKIQQIMYILQKESKCISKTEKRKLEFELCLLQEKQNPDTSFCGDLVIDHVAGTSKGYVENRQKQLLHNKKIKLIQQQIELENERKIKEKMEMRRQREEEENRHKNELNALKLNIQILCKDFCDEDC